MENLAIVLPLLWISLVIHELGHAYAAHEVGVRVERMSILGLPIGGTLKLPFHFPGMPDTELVMHPAVLGCYVALAESDMQTASRRDRLRILGGGPIASIVFGLALCLGADTWQAIAEGYALIPRHIYFVICVGCILAALWLARGSVAQYVLLPTGIATLVFVTLVVPIHDLLRASNVGFIMDVYHGRYIVASPGEIGHVEAAVLPGAIAFKDVSFAGYISAVLGISNLIPIPPLDGGQMLNLFIPEKCRGAFARSGTVVIVGIILVTFANDIQRVANAVF